MTDTIKIPEVIFLQWYGDPDTDGGGVSWSYGKINGDDVKYVNSEAVESAISVLTDLKNLVSIDYGFESPIAIRAREAIVALGGEV